MYLHVKYFPERWRGVLVTRSQLKVFLRASMCKGSGRLGKRRKPGFGGKPLAVYGHYEVRAAPDVKLESQAVAQSSTDFKACELVRQLKCCPTEIGMFGPPSDPSSRPLSPVRFSIFVNGFRSAAVGHLALPASWDALGWLRVLEELPQAGPAFFRSIHTVVVTGGGLPAKGGCDWLAAVAIVRMFPRAVRVVVQDVLFGSWALRALVWTPVEPQPRRVLAALPWVSLELTNCGITNVDFLVYAGAYGMLPRLFQLCLRQQCFDTEVVAKLVRAACPGGGLATVAQLVVEDCVAAASPVTVERWFATHVRLNVVKPTMSGLQKTGSLVAGPLKMLQLRALDLRCTEAVKRLLDAVPARLQLLHFHEVELTEEGRALVEAHQRRVSSIKVMFTAATE